MKFSRFPLTLCLLVMAASPAKSQTVHNAMSFEQARAAFLERSEQLAASIKSVDSARLRREGMEGLGGPSVSITGMAYRYSANVDVDLDPARRALGNGISLLPPQLGGAVAQLPSLPSNYDLQRKSNVGSASLAAVWPVYIGGLGDAVRGELDAMTDEAVADAASSRAQLQTLLVQRYFTAQLADRNASLRRRALEGVRAHDDAAQRMLKAGVISQVERLQASAALADAQQQSRKADDDARLAHSALARTVHAGAAVRPSSPLFVSSEALPPLLQFLDSALNHHPGLSQVAAKQRQAASLHDASEALRKPQVLAFGLREVNTTGKPSWVAGVAVRWTLWDSIDRDKLSAAGLRKVEQAELMDAQVRSDIGLLVEKNWLAVEQSRTQYLAGQAQENLARELLRLRQAGLKEGTSTTLDLIDAQLNLAKVQTERALVANQYVQALAALLESTGQSDEFSRYMARADIQITADTP
ncbi:TolC family protein [Comamonas sp. CMM03]|uniref:TolC family protein n=2 Tax=Comamonadaceae TaxID=80864 RepID=A0A2A7UUT4_COMTR|nr:MULTISPECIES: TolC family protein [Comamonas]MBV7420393.1 TolC family protein [Comamonas sp. CMM03]PEH89033.1 TolC family protein [Comamonas terrigena]BBL24126.1 membrane protein [Comamonas terrigena NBRC 13299]SUY72274.1 type I secretion outer membrane protein, TolC family [Comamonas terrigena]